MKVSLVVATGVHQGKVIPVPAAEFLIGRDPHCQLRPASQAVSKQHCGVLTRGEKVFVRDYGSTNGTFVNDVQLEANAEQEVQSGERLRVGPLDFAVSFTPGKISDSTPLPDALKSVSGSPALSLAAAATGSKTVAPAPKPASSATQKPAPKPAPQPAAAAPDESDPDRIAALLLGMGDDEAGGTGHVPEGSTIFEMPAVTADGKPVEKKDDGKKGVPSKEGMSNAASDILRKYMRRPR